MKRPEPVLLAACQPRESFIANHVACHNIYDGLIHDAWFHVQIAMVRLNHRDSPHLVGAVLVIELLNTTAASMAEADWICLAFHNGYTHVVKIYNATNFYVITCRTKIHERIRKNLSDGRREAALL